MQAATLILALLASALACSLQGCLSPSTRSSGSDDSGDDDEYDFEPDPEEATLPCNDDGCEVTFSCTYLGEFEIKVSGCKNSYTRHIATEVKNKDFANFNACKAEVGMQKRHWKVNSKLACLPLVNSPNLTVQCDEKCKVTQSCYENDKQTTEETVGCNGMIHLQITDCNFDECMMGLDMAKEDKMTICEGLTDMSPMLIDDHAVSENISSPNVLFLTEEKGLYMLLGGILMTLTYLLLRGLVSIVAGKKEARKAQLVAASGQEQTEMHQISAAAP